MLDPNDPFLEQTIRNMIQQEMRDGTQGGLIRQLQGRFSMGVSSLTFSGAAQSATTTVSHTLGVAPTSVVAVTGNAPSFGKIPNLNVFTFTSSSFQINGETVAAHTGSINFYWLAGV